MHPLQQSVPMPDAQGYAGASVVEPDLLGQVARLSRFETLLAQADDAVRMLRAAT